MIKLLLITLIFTTTIYANEIYVKAKKEGNKIIAYAYNHTIHHATIKYNAKIKNLTSLCPLPVITSIKPRTRAIMCEFFINSSKFNYNGSFKWVLGTQHAKHNDDYLYRLPYDLNTKQQVTQGFNGLFSHFGNSKYAIDFGMKKGTKVYASRGGTIVKTQSKSRYGGNSKKFLDKANHITILHDDNTYAVYNHLMYNGVKVKVGQKVKRGDLIGYSGNTGYTNGPHLHLVVYKIVDTEKRETIPIKFKTKRGILTNPLRGMYYTAVN